MNIVTIAGKSSFIKSEALSKLAGQHPILTGSALESMIPALKSKAIALAPDTFVDDASGALLTKLQALSKSYPAHYTLFVCLQA